jgi:hypothetical protein
VKKTLIGVAAIIAVVAVAIPTASAARPITPSKTRAIHDTKAEIGHYFAQKMRVECGPLSDTLYRCSWAGGLTHYYKVSGLAKVRFYKYGTDVTLYQVNCQVDPSQGADYCS